MLILRYILSPFSFLYYCIMFLRNFLFDHNIWMFKSDDFDTCVINIGNITVGGTGKSPMVLYLANYISTKYKTIILSRGYGRHTKGIMELNDSNANYLTVGDEPAMFYRQSQKKYKIAVGERRAVAIPYLLHKYPDNQVIILDDAYQHRQVKPYLNILMIDFSRPIYNDYVLPTGWLREGRGSIKRAHAIVVSKCPEGVGYKKEYFKIKHAKYLNDNNIPFFFTSISYLNPTQFCGNTTNLETNHHIIVLTSIANAKPFIQYLSNKYQILAHLKYADHQVFTAKDFANIIDTYHIHKKKAVAILMTEKDMIKFANSAGHKAFGHIPLFYIPIEISFADDDEAKFHQFIDQKLNAYYRR
ncbi:MAG: tetraacyldisaccharide 4'-kinase [Cytophagales bacterium]|nr:tetraacyldisaccharide 4'-kinase [Cytophagales bacterium]